jgi:hypothetical protein
VGRLHVSERCGLDVWVFVEGVDSIGIVKKSCGGRSGRSSLINDCGVTFSAAAQ